MTREAPKIKTTNFIARLRDAAKDDSLDLETARKLLGDAADTIEAAEKLCQVYFEIAETQINQETIRIMRKERFGA